MPGTLIYLMGPSGVGKDSLIESARGPLKAFECEVVRRVITRSAESVGEDAMGVSLAEFERLREQGAFALCWRANGLEYGIPAQIDAWLALGRNVLVNGSRGHLQQARMRYPDLLPILLRVDASVLRQRLIRRGRETAAQIEDRLTRNALLERQVKEEGAGRRIVSMDNSGALDDTVTALLDLLRQAGIAPQAAADHT